MNEILQDDPLAAAGDLRASLAAQLDAAWETVLGAQRASELEGFGLVLGAPFWDVMPAPAIGAVPAEVIAARGEPAAVDLLVALERFAPPWVGQPAAEQRAQLAQQGVQGRFEASLGALQATASHTLTSRYLRMHVVRLERSEDREHRLFLLTEQREFRSDVPVLRGGLQDPASVEETDRWLADLLDDVRDWQRDEPSIEATVDRLGVTLGYAADAGLRITEELGLTLPVLARALTGDPGGLPRPPVLLDADWDIEAEAAASGHLGDDDGLGADGPGAPAAGGDPAAKRAKRRAQKAARKRNRRR